MVFLPSDVIPQKRPPACLTWKVVAEKVPWAVVVLIGGGSAMATAATKSGLSSWLGSQFEVLQVLPKEAMVLVVCLVVTMMTEVVSNTATALVFLPVLREMVRQFYVGSVPLAFLFKLSTKILIMSEFFSTYIKGICKFCLLTPV